MKTQILIHFLLFIAFLTLPYAFSHEEFSVFIELQKNPNERSKLLAYILMYGFFYLSYYVLIPKFIFKRRYFTFILIGIMAFISIVSISKSINWFGKSPSMPPPHSHSSSPISDDEIFKKPPPHFPRMMQKPPLFGFELTQTVLLFLIGIFLTIAMRFAKKLHATESEKLHSELAYLKAQINPHFLFNTLNTLFASALIEKAPNTADSLIKLSAMMRYLATESAYKFVSLEKEMEYIKHYIDLQKMRFGDAIDINFIIEGDISGKHIAPIILINFIENAFKYGVNTEENSTIDIKITILNNTLNLYIFNKKTTHIPIESSGLGIENTRQRLDVIYPNKHLLTITDTPMDYTVSLQIILT